MSGRALLRPLAMQARSGSSVLVAHSRPLLRKATATTLTKSLTTLTTAQPLLTLASTPRMSPSTAFGSRRTLFIQTESTPSDDAIRFKPGTAVLGPDAKSTVEFTSRGAAQSGGSPLAASLLSIDGILSVLFSTDAVTITKDATTPWQLVKPDVFGALTDHFGQSPVPPVADPSLASSPPEDTVVRADDSEVVAMIKELLDTRIRPTIQDDGGDIEYMGFDESEGTVKLKLKGACRTCDSSVVTLKNGIENMLQYFIPEVKKVEQVLDVAEQVAKEEFDKMEHKLMAAAEEASNFGSVQLKQ